jgi:hypothetical protein
METRGEWTTVVTRSALAMAQLDAALLREHGLNAVVPDTEASSTLWHVSIALGGVRVQVPAEDVVRARLLLGLNPDGDGTGDSDVSADGSDIGDAWKAGGEVHSADAAWLASRSAQPDAAAALQPGQRTNASRALNSAIVGFMVPPLHFYTIALAIRPDPVVPSGKSDWLPRAGALVIAIPSVLLQVWLLVIVARLLVPAQVLL